MKVLLIVTFLGVTSAMVCLPSMCKNMATPEPLNCAGSVIKNGGFCGCTDVCAKVEGETCQRTFMFGIPYSAGTCDTDMECTESTAEHMRQGLGVCQRKVSKESKRFVNGHKQTRCEQMRAVRLTSFVIYRGMWTPRCDYNGQFMPKQCDNEHKCFCVDANEGNLLTERMLGDVDCSSVSSDVTTTAVAPKAKRFMDVGPDGKQTLCQQMRAVRMISFVIYDGMWTPNCDVQGLFMPKQCDNQHKCFCVDANDGHLLTGRMLGDVDCSSVSSDVTTTTVAPKAKRFMDVGPDGKQTLCQQMRAVRMISFVIYDGMWTPNCDVQGLFMPKQCDNQHKCFCVDANDGHLLTERMLGDVDCSSVSSDVKTTTVAPKAKRFMDVGPDGKQTLCQQMRAVRMISMVIYDGMWTPNCDVQGLFMPKQCDNQHKCFCVAATDGHLLTERMLGDVDCSSVSSDVTTTAKSPVIKNKRTISKCRQMKAQAMTSFVIYQGMWVPQCDQDGNFMQEQCDYDHKCFCVDTHEGTLLTERMLGHPDCSAVSSTNAPSA